MLLSSLVVGFSTACASGPSAVIEAETIYADLNDARSVIGALDSGLFASYQGKDRAAWQRVFQEKRAELARHLAALPDSGQPASDANVVAVLRAKLESFTGIPASENTQWGQCEDSLRKDVEFAALKRALVGCFAEIANGLSFENGRIDRVSALGMLHELDEPDRRKTLFLAFAPLWRAVNGDNEADSPYRRLMALAAAEAADDGSEIDAAARTVGVTRAELELWLQQVLERWRTVTAGDMVEPWDYRYRTGAADRQLASRISLEALLPINQHFYRELGADLDELGVRYDLAPRAGKSPVAYTDFLVHGRTVDGRWQPTIARVLASYREGTLGALNELVHENGHAVHVSAIRNRPAYVDWNDDLFVEAFADVSSWSVYEPAWQRRHLGADVPEADSLRALYGGVMLDVAWALFESRLLRDPTADPNALWTEITSHYLHIVPHPDISWWAVRTQLVELPGYMVNYGLGAVVTADLRERIRDAIGPFDTGNPRWYPWLSANLLRYGSERDTATLLRTFLGRSVSPAAVLGQIQRMAPGRAQRGGAIWF